VLWSLIANANRTTTTTEGLRAHIHELLIIAIRKFSCSSVAVLHRSLCRKAEASDDSSRVQPDSSPLSTNALNKCNNAVLKLSTNTVQAQSYGPNNPNSMQCLTRVGVLKSNQNAQRVGVLEDTLLRIQHVWYIPSATLWNEVERSPSREKTCNEITKKYTF
jgi:hypothetical protein